MTRRRTLSLAILVAAVVCVYAQTLRFDFVSYDDYDLVYHNEDFLQAPGSLLASFATHVFTTHRSEGYYYRPLLLVSYILDYHVWQLNPLGYHLTNMLLHMITAWIVFLLLESLVGQFLPALLGALLFALHPIQTESVAWVAGRNDVLLGLFIALMAYSYITYWEGDRSRFIVLAMASFVLALFTKEAGAFFILLWPAYELTVKNVPPRALFGRRTSGVWAIGALILIGYLLVRLKVFGQLIGAETMYGSGPFSERLKHLPGILSEHLALLVFPHQLSVVRPIEGLLWWRAPWNIAAVLIPLLLVAAIVWSFRRDRIICFGLLWLGTGLVPVLGMFPLAVPVLEHRLYTASIGLMIILARILARAGERRSSRIPSIIAAVALCALAGIGSAFRIPVWKNSETLWSDAIQKAPAVPRSYYNLAGYYYERGEYRNTIGLLGTYMELRPGDFLGYSKLRQTYALQGDLGNVASVSREMIARAPRNQNLYLDAGRFYESMNLPDSAIVIYREGLSLDSAFREIRMELGAVYEGTGRYGSAEEIYRQLIRMEPASAAHYFALGRLYARMGRPKDAMAAIGEGMKFGQPPAEIRELIRYLSAAPGGGK